MERLRNLLRRIDGRGYKAYKDLKGTYRFDGYILSIDHVQGDPFAAPSRISLFVPAERAGFPEELISTRIRRRAVEDYLGRATAKAITSVVKGRRGIGKSGQVHIEKGGQQVLVRNAVIISGDGIEARVTVGLPAAGRTILGREAEDIFFREMPEVVRRGLIYDNLDASEIRRHVESVEDQDFLRKWLDGEGLVAFIADGAILPRRSGVDDRPLDSGAVPFMSPDSLARKVTLPNRGDVRGMAIPKGVTLIVGGGFHGKSTLLHALERGVYNHIPGDGRELVVTDPGAVKVRAEDGRSISRVNISPFIDNLPFGRDTKRFSTENASGSTSQAANIVEALETGAELLLIDEDTSATNFMIRDERMQKLVAKDKEPITPFLHRVRELYVKMGVSTIVVMGGSGDYFGVSDTVIMMDAYVARDVTAEARSIAGPHVEIPGAGDLPPFEIGGGRRPDPRRLDPSRGRRDVKIDAKDIDTILYGEHTIDLSKVEQIVEMGQTRAIALLILYYARHYLSGTSSLVEGLKLAFHDIEEKGLDILSPYKVGNLAMPRLHEAAAAVNRIRCRG